LFAQIEADARASAAAQAQARIPQAEREFLRVITALQTLTLA
jgi:hypothetical protein